MRYAIHGAAALSAALHAALLAIAVMSGGNVPGTPQAIEVSLVMMDRTPELRGEADRTTGTGISPTAEPPPPRVQPNAGAPPVTAPEGRRPADRQARHPGRRPDVAVRRQPPAPVEAAVLPLPHDAAAGRPAMEPAPVTASVDRAATSHGNPPRPVASGDWGIAHRVAPAYPAGARRRGIEGRVLLAVSFTADGVPRLVRIEGSSGNGQLDEAARAAVERWRFRTDRALTVEVPVVFRLRSSPGPQQVSNARARD